MLNKAYTQLSELATDQKIRRRTVESKIEEYEGRLAQLETDVQKYHEARHLFLEAARFTREKTVGDVERNLTAALRAIFQDPTMSFHVEITEKRGALDAEFQIWWSIDGKMIAANPLDAKGGSLIDVITTGLMIVFLKTFRPKKRPILFLDEPGKFLDSERRARYGRWLVKISHDLETQIVMITHDEELKAIADRTFKLRQDAKAEVQVEMTDALDNLSGYGI